MLVRTSEEQVACYFACKLGVDLGGYDLSQIIPKGKMLQKATY